MHAGSRQCSMGYSSSAPPPPPPPNTLVEEKSIFKKKLIFIKNKFVQCCVRTVQNIYNKITTILVEFWIRNFCMDPELFVSDPDPGRMKEQI